MDRKDTESFNNKDNGSVFRNKHFKKELNFQNKNAFLLITVFINTRLLKPSIGVKSDIFNLTLPL